MMRSPSRLGALILFLIILALPGFSARAAESPGSVYFAPVQMGFQPNAPLVAAHAPVFVLVSCDPASLARDTALLAAAGYRHDGTVVLDLFPHTHHVETVTRFVLAD